MHNSKEIQTNLQAFTATLRLAWTANLFARTVARRLRATLNVIFVFGSMVASLDAAMADCTAELYRPCEPVEVTASVDVGPSIRVTWTLYNDPPSKLVVYRTPNGGPFTSEGAIIVPTLVGFMRDNSVALNTHYTYQVCAVYDDSPYCSAGVQQWLPATAGGGGVLNPPVFGPPQVNRGHIRVSWNKGEYVKFNLRGDSLGQVENQSGIYDYYGSLSGRTYTFWVQGRTQDGRWSPWSPPQTIHVNIPPKAPERFYVEGIVPNTHYRLHWRGDREAEAYRITRGRGPSREKTWYKRITESVPERERPHEFDDTDQLAPFTEYWYELCALNVSQVVDPVNASCVRETIKTHPDIAAAPTDVRVNFVANGAEVTWTGNDDTVIWFEVERRGSSGWKLISKKLIRRADGKQSYLDTESPRNLAALDPSLVPYRVCAGNVIGRSCSRQATARVVRDVGKFAVGSVMRIRQVQPLRYAKAHANPTTINVTLVYSGANAKYVSYRSDAGPWVSANENVPLSLVEPGKLTVMIPSSVFQNSARSVDVRLANEGSEDIGTIQVVLVDPTSQVKDSKGLRTNVPSSREQSRAPDAVKSDRVGPSQVRIIPSGSLNQR